MTTTEDECCKNNPRHGWVPKTQVLDMIEETGKEIHEVVDAYIRSEPSDSLELIFQKQNELLDYLNQSKPDNYYNGPERYPFEKVMHMMTAMSDEFSEVRAGLNWKHWKNYESDDDMDLICATELAIEDDSHLHEKLLEAREQGQKQFLSDDQRATQKQIMDNSKLEYLQNEWIDILHFWVQGAQELGLDSKKTLELYLNKNKENHARQDEGY